MREIKFRVVDVLSKKIIGYEKLEFGGWWISIDLNPDGGERWINGVFPQDSSLKRLQYTELKDNNGKEIYERDIFKYSPPYTGLGEPTVYVEEVVFCDGCFDVVDFNLCAFNEHGVVIGNIYENPELIEKA